MFNRHYRRGWQRGMNKVGYDDSPTTFNLLLLQRRGRDLQQRLILLLLGTSVPILTKTSGHTYKTKRVVYKEMMKERE